MKTPPLRPFLIAALLALLDTSLVSQAADVSGPATGSISEPAIASKPRTALINIVFPGGSVAELVSAINRSEGTSFNLIAEKSHQEVQLPSFTLRNADPASLAVALNGLLRSRELTINLAGSNIFVLTKSASPTSAYAPAAPTFQAYQLAPYLANLSVEDITDAISAAWASDAAHDPKLVRFKYHPTTKLLFVYGPPEAINIATQVIPQLNPTATARARYEYLRSPTDPLLQIPTPSPEQEAARLAAVAAEVARRRDLRDQGQMMVAPTPPAPKAAPQK
jgi:hypothetical protein